MHELQGRGVERLRLQDVAGRKYPLRDELLFEQAILAHGKGMARRQRSLVGRVIDALHRSRVWLLEARASNGGLSRRYLLVWYRCSGGLCARLVRGSQLAAQRIPESFQIGKLHTGPAPSVPANF